jgi:hypothetical protein
MGMALFAQSIQGGRHPLAVLARQWSELRSGLQSAALSLASTAMQSRLRWPSIQWANGFAIANDDVVTAIDLNLAA